MGPLSLFRQQGIDGIAAFEPAPVFSGYCIGSCEKPMEHGRNPGQNIWQGVVSAFRWLAKILLIGAALYILFPPFWDALFAANLKALHDAPYRAADRARNLWNGMRSALGEVSIRPGGKPPAEALATDPS